MLSIMPTLAERMEPHRGALFGLCYRLLGSAADAEDLVQDTFARALERPPADLDGPLGPWLTKVATRLSIDALRHRRSRAYVGPWLPSPVPIDAVCDGVTAGPEARLGLRESATMAFLVALEALDERQRAALVLRDVLGLDGVETAEALETSPGNVRVILHRARKALEGREPTAPTEEERARVTEMLQRLMLALATGESANVLAALADDVVTVHDAGGEFVAAVRPLRGAEDVARFYLNIREQTPPPRVAKVVELNGLPALVVDLGERPGRYASRFTVHLELDGEGRIRAIRSVFATPKLTRVDFGGTSPT